ncbi:hypothetical protein BaRGS_00040043 [Batillaria attramentaria]|uniref:Uncharacterized protein n=1 Tax=Batillaria attramentaria TaxID=370345 RepID=A0ABD0J1C7_9CAEN
MYKPPKSLKEMTRMAVKSKTQLIPVVWNYVRTQLSVLDVCRLHSRLSGLSLSDSICGHRHKQSSPKLSIYVKHDPAMLLLIFLDRNLTEYQNQKGKQTAASMKCLKMVATALANCSVCQRYFPDPAVYSSTDI